MNIEAPYTHTGYGYCAYNITRQMREDVPLALFPIYDKLAEEFAPDIKPLWINNQYIPDAPFLKIWHEHDLIRRIGRGKYGALVFFEINSLDKLRIDNMKTPDVLMVSCQWARHICKQYGIEAEVVPMGVDRDIFKPELRKLNNRFEVLNCGKWEIRKGHDILAEIFAEAFPDEKDVRLNLITSNPFLTDKETLEWLNLYYNTLGVDRVKIHGRIDTHTDVARIMNDCSIGIFPSRAEGWNMEALEMLSCGKPIIITDYSAHTEYCRKDNSFLIDIDSLEPAYDGKWFFGQSQWAEIGDKQKKDMVAGLRYYYEQWKKGDPLFNIEGVATAKRLTWWSTAEKIRQLLS